LAEGGGSFSMLSNSSRMANLRSHGFDVCWPTICWAKTFAEGSGNVTF
jgi:hypothetical protein